MLVGENDLICWDCERYDICAIGSINSHYFHIGDGKINPIVGVYIPIINIIRIPSLKVG